jgi:ribonuclease Z
MRLCLLGTGTPILDLQRQATTAILLEIGADRILCDAGRGVTTQLLNQAIPPTTVDTILITHHHYDHICDLGEFLLSAWHNGRVDPIQVFGPHGTTAIVNVILSSE